MEILKLLTEAASSINEDDNDDIPITDPGDPTDFNYDSNKQVQTTHEWGNWDYFDLFISFAGVYVSLVSNSIIFCVQYILSQFLLHTCKNFTSLGCTQQEKTLYFLQRSTLWV